MRAVRAYTLDLALLDRAQHHRLQRQRQLAHLVQEERAAVGDLELPRAVAHGAGEGAAHVAEQFAGGQRLGQRRAVHLDERLGAAQRVQVQVARHQLLAHTRLAGDQHGQVRGGHRRQFRQQRPHRAAAAEDALAGGLAGRALQVARHQFAPRRGRFERFDQGRRAHGGAGQRGERRQQLQVHAVEGARVECIGGQCAHDAVVVHQHAAQARMHIGQFTLLAGQQAVEGIGQARVGGEAHRFARGEDRIEPRVLTAVVGPDHRLRRQPHGRERHQRLALQSQQAGRIAGDQPLHRRQQPLVAVSRRQRGGQVARDVEQGREGRVLHAGSFRGVIKYITTLSSQ